MGCTAGSARHRARNPQLLISPAGAGHARDLLSVGARCGPKRSNHCSGGKIATAVPLRVIERLSPRPLPESGLSSRKSSGTISGMWQPRHRDVPGRERAGRGLGLKRGCSSRRCRGHGLHSGGVAGMARSCGRGQKLRISRSVTSASSGTSHASRGIEGSSWQAKATPTNRGLRLWGCSRKEKARS